MREKQEKRIAIHANSVQDVDDLLYFMCTNQLRYNCDPLHLVQLAHYYEMDRLFSECIRKLRETVSINNFVEIVKIFDKYEVTNGYESLIEFGKNNLTKLQKMNSFQQLSHCFRFMLCKKT
eukprot:45575_1